MGHSYQLKRSYAATATALMIGMPPVGFYDLTARAPTQTYQYESFAELGKIISESFSLPAGSHYTAEPMFALMAEAATRLVLESKPLNRDFAKVVQREFWNLIQ